MCLVAVNYELFLFSISSLSGKKKKNQQNPYLKGLSKENQKNASLIVQGAMLDR